MKENNFTQVATYQYSSEALIYKGKLESEGIEVFLRDMHTVDSNPLYSNAVGGIKMFVKTEEAQVAYKILDEISKFSIDNKGNLLRCPQCNNESVEMYTSITNAKSLLSFVFSFFVILLPIHAKHKYKCQSCKFEFLEK